MKITSKLRFQLLVQNGLFIGLLVAIAASIIILAQKADMRWDLTYSQRNTLSSATIETLKKITVPVSITAFVTTDAEGDLRQPIIDFLTPYKLQKDDINIGFIDPREDPFAAKQAGVSVNGELVIELNGRTEKLKTLDEQDLTNLLIKLMRSDQQVITALVGHGEGDFSRQGSKDLSDLGKKLSSRGFQLNILNFASGQDIDPANAVLIIASPTVTLLPGEVNRIKRYLEKGGNLLWLLDYETSAGLSNIAQYLGINLPSGIVVDPSSRLQRMPVAFSIADTYADHPTTKVMRINTVFPYSRAILGGNSQSFTFTPLVEVAPQGWLETSGLKNATFENEQDLKGPITIAAALERNVGEKIQRIVVFGSGRAFTNEFLASLGNADLASNIINWMSGDESLIAIEPKTRIDMTLKLPAIAVSLFVSGFLFVIPVGLLLTGTFIWWRRRRA